MLFELALVLGGGKALELLRVLTPDEEERLAGVLRNTWRVNETMVRTFEKLTVHARQADDAFGPAALLPVVNAHRTALRRLLSQSRCRHACGTGYSGRMPRCRSWLVIKPTIFAITGRPSNCWTTA